MLPELSRGASLRLAGGVRNEALTDMVSAPDGVAGLDYLSHLVEQFQVVFLDLRTPLYTFSFNSLPSRICLLFGLVLRNP